jgi:hypothetical protein
VSKAGALDVQSDVVREDPTLEFPILRHMFSSRRPEDLARFEEGLRMAALPE